jgi:hypothetical protein
MSTITLSYRVYSEGQIALEQALFCLECELIFAGIVSCPRCAGKAVWPLSGWVRPTRPTVALSKVDDSLVDISHYESVGESYASTSEQVR